MLMANTMVRHKKVDHGLGIIAYQADETKDGRVGVSFGRGNSFFCNEDDLEEVDTSACKEISADEIKAGEMIDGTKVDEFILGSCVTTFENGKTKSMRQVLSSDLLTLPRAVDKF